MQEPVEHNYNLQLMFKAFFGNRDNQQKVIVAASPPPPPPVSKDVEAQKIIMGLQRNIAQLNDKANNLENKAEILAQKAKECMAKKRTKDAKQIVSQLAEIKKTIDVIQSRKKVLRKEKNSLQVARIDLTLANQLGQANIFMEGLQKVNDQMFDVLADAKMNQQRMEENNRIISSLAGEDEENEEQDKLFKELEQQVEQDNAANVTERLNQNRQKVVKPVSVASTTSSSKMSLEDDIEMYLNSL